MTQLIFYNNYCSTILILMLYCAIYYYGYILCSINLKNNAYIPFYSSRFDEIVII